MAVDSPVLLAFNRGLISKLALARVDLDRTALSAEVQTNWMPRVLGSMMFRPGLEYILTAPGVSRHIPFIASLTDLSILEISNLKLRIIDPATGAAITRPTVTATVTNGGFDTDLTGWMDADDAGSASAWATGDYLGLTGTGFASARTQQEITINESGVHALRIVVALGPVTLRIGSTAGDDDVFTETTLSTGTHSIAFTTAANVHIELSASRQYQALVDSVEIETNGAVELPTPWAESDLDNIRYDQSLDVIFIACQGYSQKRIERRNNGSWSVVDYTVNAGPFGVENIGPISLTPSALTGNITVTASDKLFKSGQVGALFRLTSTGQQVEAIFTAESQFSDPIRVTGVGATQRRFSYDIDDLTGTGTTLTLQRSLSEVGAWIDVSSFTADVDTTLSDGLDNQIAYYRIGCKTGDYSSGTITVALEYATSGSIDGIVQLTAIASATSASAIVLKPLGGVTGTTIWSEGEWSDTRGWPSAVALYQGRLWWGGLDRIWGSVSDAFNNFDDTAVGDSGPINRAIGGKSTANIAWIMPARQLLVGTDLSAYSARSSSLDEPLTPGNFALTAVTTQGCARVDPVQVDKSGYYLQRNGSRVYGLDLSQSGYLDYGDSDATALVPEVGEPSIVRIGVQRQPDTRIHCIRSDGKVAIFVAEPAENVTAWVLFETDGSVEDVIVLPGEIEDQVFYSIKRTVDGIDYRYLEKWGLESEAQGEAVTRLSDSHLTYSGDLTYTLPAAHLEGKQLVVWTGSTSLDDANGDAKLYTVSGGVITLGSKVSEAVYGLPYTGSFKSAKLAYAAGIGTSLNMRKRAYRLGLVAADLHARGVKYGQSFDDMYRLPGIEGGAPVDQDSIWPDYDEPMFEFGGDWSSDARLCLLAASPRPATLLAVPFAVEGHKDL